MSSFMLRATFVMSLLAVSLFGAGCITAPTVTHTAESLAENPNTQQPLPQNGFGPLKIPQPIIGKTPIKLLAPIPDIPAFVTVIRLPTGTPNLTQLSNLASSLQLPGGLMGPKTKSLQLALEWDDGQGIHWSYDANTHTVSFKQTTTPLTPLTLSRLPTNDDILHVADAFLLSHSINVTRYRSGIIGPDWNNWWLRSEAAGKCMDTFSLFAVRAIAGLTSNTSIDFPNLIEAKNGHCVATEFPNLINVHYHSMMNNIDIVGDDGQSIDGAILTIDASHQSVVRGQFTLPIEAEYSDYPAWPRTYINNLLTTENATTTDTIKKIDVVLWQQKSLEGATGGTYLIPALLGQGSRRILIPLLTQTRM